jgi:Fucose permease
LPFAPEGTYTRAMPASATRLIRSPALWALYALLGLFAFVQNMIGPAVPFLRAEFKLDYGTAALHMSAFAFGQVVSGLSAGIWIHRFGVRRVLWAGMLGALLGISGLVLAPVPAASLVSILFMSYTGTLSLSCIQASIAGLAGESRGQALMEANMGASLASAAAPFVLVAGSALGLGWRALWPVFFLGLALTAAFGYRPLDRALPGTRSTSVKGRSGRMSGPFWLILALIFVGVGTEWSVGFWATEYLKGLPGGSVSLAAAGAGVFQIAAVCGRLTSSRLMGRFGERRLLGAAMILTLAGFPLYWLRADPVSAFAGLALCGLGVANFYPLALSLALAAVGDDTAKASSLTASFSGAAIFTMPLALGLVADRAGLPAALWAIPCGLAVMAILLLALRGKGDSARAFAER